MFDTIDFQSVSSLALNERKLEYGLAGEGRDIASLFRRQRLLHKR